jgi:hypothetical protein
VQDSTLAVFGAGSWVLGLHCAQCARSSSRSHINAVSGIWAGPHWGRWYWPWLLFTVSLGLGLATTPVL